jgi:hypothetical protein
MRQSNCHFVFLSFVIKRKVFTENFMSLYAWHIWQDFQLFDKDEQQSIWRILDGSQVPLTLAVMNKVALEIYILLTTPTQINVNEFHRTAWLIKKEKIVIEQCIFIFCPLWNCKRWYSLPKLNFKLKCINGSIYFTFLWPIDARCT